MTVETVKLYSRSEVADRNGKDGKEVWIIIRDSVYDVTQYMNKHPGSSELIGEFAGKDATKDFENFGHSGDASKILKTLKIGDLVEEDKKSNKLKNDKLTSNQSATEMIIKKRRLRRFLLFCA